MDKTNVILKVNGGGGGGGGGGRAGRASIITFQDWELKEANHITIKGAVALNL